MITGVHGTDEFARTSTVPVMFLQALSHCCHRQVLILRNGATLKGCSEVRKRISIKASSNWQLMIAVQINGIYSASGMST